jgi:multisubunit Na+/H+ antiporter MnhE subunit
MKEIQNRMDSKNCLLGALAGIIIGLLLLPVLKAARPEMFTFKINLSLIIFFYNIYASRSFFRSLLGNKV